MAEQVAVITPESVDFSLDVAGLGSRAAALLVDEIIKGVAAGLVGVGAFFLGRAVGEETLPGIIVTAAGLILAVVIYAAYHIILEAAWSGRTVGKRLMGLRVVKDTGVPIGFVDALLRNLLRLVDALPSFYLVGIIAIFATAQHKRVGDMAAATLVIKERSLKAPAVAVAPSDSGTGGPAARLALLPRIDYQEAELIRNFLGRRQALASEARRDLASRLAGALRRQGVTPALLELGEAAADEEILEAWAAQQG
ncbi:MAG: RDD family protein [Symbiobacteriia bacterium]